MAARQWPVRRRSKSALGVPALGDFLAANRLLPGPNRGVLLALAGFVRFGLLGTLADLLVVLVSHDHNLSLGAHGDQAPARAPCGSGGRRLRPSTGRPSDAPAGVLADRHPADAQPDTHAHADSKADFQADTETDAQAGINGDVLGARLQADDEPRLR